MPRRQKPSPLIRYGLPFLVLLVVLSMVPSTWGNDPTIPVCPDGFTFDDAVGRCVLDDPGDPPDVVYPNRLVGWDLKGMNWQLTANSWENQQVFAQMRQYGVNMVRRHFVTSPLMEEGDATRATYVQRMKANAELAAQNGMWIIFDMYARPIYAGSGGLEGMYWQWQMPEEDFLDMWELLATELKAYPNVILELGNEPNDQSNSYPEHRDIWLQRCINAIERMRGVGFAGYIVIPFPEVATHGHTGLAYRDQVRAADLLDRYMWDYHYYWYWQENQAGSPNDTSESAIRSWLSSHGISQLRAMGDRVLCGEFGVHGQSYDARDLTHFQNHLRVLNAEGYDYCAQSYQPGTDFPMLTGTLSTTDWKTLNTQGRYYVNNKAMVSYYGETQTLLSVLWTGLLSLLQGTTW